MHDELDHDEHDEEDDVDEGLVLVHVALLALYNLLWSLHWSAKGDPSYGDHLLWERATKTVRKDVDRVAELVASVYEAETLDPAFTLERAVELLHENAEDDYHPAIRALMLVRHVSELVELVHNEDVDHDLAAQNVLAGVADHLNEIEYLAQQRLGGPAAAGAMIEREIQARRGD
jgi:DNA-binding ferritin-like protein